MEGWLHPCPLHTADFSYTQPFTSITCYSSYTVACLFLNWANWPGGTSIFRVWISHQISKRANQAPCTEPTQHCSAFHCSPWGAAPLLRTPNHSEFSQSIFCLLKFLVLPTYISKCLVLFAVYSTYFLALSNTCLLFQMPCSSPDWAFSQPRTFPKFVSPWKSQGQHRCIRYVHPAAGVLKFAVFLPGQGLQSSCKLF